ncbi:GNAT family N-acetyltransferase [Chelativorans sp.]|uniref:GNAT family N-acetyltransferase n=1 Tax=Chelativorans sp. TaxID=2203393 RepID=UPI002811A85D|nr:GNAT family N-acetyltransferase [Chelativorans sp.]
MPYELRAVRSAEDWRHLHEIRRSVLFTPERHADVEYDENHPDDRAEGNIPLLLLFESRPVGVVRLDVRGEAAIVRLVAVIASERGRGHGRILGALVEEEARRRGARTLFVNAAPDAVGYYEKVGWRRFDWNTSELQGIAQDCVQLRKDL